MTRNGRVRYELKTPYRNGTTHVLFEPLDIMYRKYGMPRAQEAQERPSPGWSPWSPNPALTLHAFMAYSRRIVSIGHWWFLQSVVEEKELKPKMRHQTKPLPRSGLQ
jgi:hypothetical protein